MKIFYVSPTFSIGFSLKIFLVLWGFTIENMSNYVVKILTFLVLPYPLFILQCSVISQIEDFLCISNFPLWYFFQDIIIFGFFHKISQKSSKSEIQKSSRKSLWHVRGTLGHPGKGLKVGSDTVATHSICPVGSYRVIHYFWFWFLHHHRVKLRWKIYIFGSSKGIFQSKMICNISNCRFLIKLQLSSLDFLWRCIHFCLF